MPAPIRVAHSSGIGAGRFLHRSLYDSLYNRPAWIAAVVRPGEARAGWIEFVFRRNGNETEIIRSRSSDSGQPCEVEIWLLSQCPDDNTPHPDRDELFNWLHLTLEQSIISEAAVLVEGTVRLACGAHRISLRCHVAHGGNPDLETEHRPAA